MLGPLLFLVFINDLSRSVAHSNVILFADYTAIYYSGKRCIEIQNKISEDLALVKRWLNVHRLTMIIAKSKFVVVEGKRHFSLCLLLYDLDIPCFQLARWALLQLRC